MMNFHEWVDEAGDAETDEHDKLVDNYIVYAQRTAAELESTISGLGADVRAAQVELGQIRETLAKALRECGCGGDVLRHALTAVGAADAAAGFMRLQRGAQS